MDGKSNVISWFEIPVADLDRAKKFYETIFNMEMGKMEMGKDVMYTFPTDPESGATGGAIIKDENAISKMDGATLYLNANPSMDVVIDKIENAGGKILKGKTQISPEIGFMAFFNDTEGNRMALFSNG